MDFAGSVTVRRFDSMKSALGSVGLGLTMSYLLLSPLVYQVVVVSAWPRLRKGSGSYTQLFIRLVLKPFKVFPVIGSLRKEMSTTPVAFLSRSERAL